MLLNKGVIPLRVDFDDDVSALLDMSQPRAAVWAKMIALLRKDDKPIYVEVAADTDIITQLCVPVATRVLEMYATDEEVVDVALSASDALYSLRRDHPYFRQFYDLLQDAKERDTKIMVTATLHVSDIIDVRALPTYFGQEDRDEPLPLPQPPTQVSPERATELFNMVSADNCRYHAITHACIPFNYAYSGCDIRAHLMCHMMVDEGVIPEKIWASGALKARAVNVPQCKVGWRFHVAPILTVIQAGQEVKMVIDPSLCNRPVTVDYWISLQNYPNALVTINDWQGYAYRATGSATWEKTNDDMEHCRLALEDMWATDAPPYECLLCDDQDGSKS